MQIENLITEHIDTWTSAVKQKSATGRGSSKKIELYGIKKLRELILELAVRGKLVPQDENDEPASVLLERIAEEKAQLVKDKKIKRPKLLPEIKLDDRPFKLPQGWEFERLGKVTKLENGDRSKNYPNKSVLVDSGLPFVNAGHLVDGRINKNEMTFITQERFDLLRAGKFINNDILYCLRGSLGKSAIVEGFETGAIASSLVIIRVDDNLLPKYLQLYFNSPLSAKSIRLYDNGTAQPNLSAADLAKFILPVPSITEQQRIVAKVDELMLLCDQLEQQTESSIDAHKTLVEVLLNTLTDAKDATELQTNWARVSEFFDTLFTTEHSIDQLKQTILQLAVMGKLVPQDPNDEPASKLLERIADEKAQLIADKKIKKQKALPPITDEEKPFELPNGWEWTYLQGIACFENGDRSSRYPNKSDLVNDGVPFFGAPDIFDGKLIYSDELRFITPEKFKLLSNGKLVDKDFVMLLRGTVGKVAQFRENIKYKTGFINAQMLIVRFINTSFDNYACRYFSSKYFIEQIKEKKSGAVIQQIPASKISEMKVPLPPLEEQLRIAYKLDQLMTICDQLKLQLNQAQQTQFNLTDALVAQVV